MHFRVICQVMQMRLWAGCRPRERECQMVIIWRLASSFAAGAPAATAWYRLDPEGVLRMLQVLIQLRDSLLFALRISVSGAQQLQIHSTGSATISIVNRPLRAISIAKQMTESSNKLPTSSPYQPGSRALSTLEHLNSSISPASLII